MATKFQVHGNVDGEWAWQHVAGTLEDATYDTYEEAHRAANSVRDSLRCHEEAVRVVEIEAK